MTQKKKKKKRPSKKQMLERMEAYRVTGKSPK
jgi:hypothetical protein